MGIHSRLCIADSRLLHMTLHRHDENSILFEPAQEMKAKT